MNVKCKNIRKGSCLGAALEGVAKSDEEAAGSMALPCAVGPGIPVSDVLRHDKPTGSRITQNGAREGPLPPTFTPFPSPRGSCRFWHFPVRVCGRDFTSGRLVYPLARPSKKIGGEKANSSAERPSIAPSKAPPMFLSAHDDAGGVTNLQRAQNSGIPPPYPAPQENRENIHIHIPSFRGEVGGLGGSAPRGF